MRNQYPCFELVYRTTRAPRSGAGAARNVGIFSARGDYVFLLDDDDEYRPNRFRSVLSILRENPVDAVFQRSDWVEIGTMRSLYSSGPTQDRIGNGELQLAQMLLGGGVYQITPAASCYRRQFLIDIGGYDERLRFAEDRELNLRATCVGRTAMLSGDAVATIRFHRTGLSSRQVNNFHFVTLAFSRLFKNIRDRTDETTLATVRNLVGTKFCLALHRCRKEAKNYSHRFFEGCMAILAMPLECWTAYHFRVVLVWLFWPRSK